MVQRIDFPLECKGIEVERKDESKISVRTSTLLDSVTANQWHTVLYTLNCYCINACSHTGLHTFPFSTWVLSLLTWSSSRSVCAFSKDRMKTEKGVERLVYMLFFRRDRSTLLRPKMHVIYTKLNPGDKTIPTQSTATKCQHTHTQTQWACYDV